MRPTRGQFVGAWAALIALIAPAAATAAKKQSGPKPDLKVVAIDVTGVGDHPNLVVSPNGTVPRFGVRFTIRNQSHIEAKPSTARIAIDDGRDVPFTEVVPIKKIAGGGRADKFVQITNLKPHLGFTEIAVTADFKNSIPESDYTNNRKEWPNKIVVEARQWNVLGFVTEVSKPAAGVDNKTEVQGGFHFRLTKFDDASESFEYQALGDINNHQTQGGICPYGVGDTQGKTPWPNSYLRIKADLEHYDALVPAKIATYTGTISCLGGFSYTNTFHFDDLETGSSLPHTSPSDPGHLKGSDSDSALDTTWSWSFVADVPADQMN